MIDEAEPLLSRAEEIRFLGTQYALSGLTPPPELAEEFARIQEALSAIETQAGGSTS